MCYYNGIRVTRAEFIRLKDIEKEIRLLQTNRILQSGFDYLDWPIIRPVSGQKDFEFVKMEWGFLPPTWPTREFANNKRKGYRDGQGKFHPPILTLNAIGEELLFPFKMYRDAALHRRCLILSTGFYEWRHVFPLGKKGEPLKTAIKYPYHITVPDQGYFFIAGIYQPWTDKQTGEMINTFSLITTTAIGNKVREQVHNSKLRMPTILNEELAYEWIFGKLSEQRITEIATSQFPAEKMHAHSIRKDFQSALDPCEPYKYETLPELVL